VYIPETLIFIPSAEDFLGYCNMTRVEDGEIGGYGECVSNYFNPSIPNSLIIVESLQWTELSEKLKALNPLPEDVVDLINPLKIPEHIGNLLLSVVNVPLVLGFSIMQLLSSIIRYVLVFFVRFMFVYLFYVSVGFQAILILLNRNNPTILAHPDRVWMTVGFMCVASIITLGGGLWS